MGKIATNISPILLIHGYGIGILSPFQNTKFKYGGFLGLKEEIKAGIAELYPWYQRQDILHTAQALNPATQLHIYRFERAYIEDEANQRALIEYIERHNIEYIIAHSMGTDFVLRSLMLKTPNQLKKVFLVQSDAARNFNFGSIPDYIEIHNYHHIMDHQLWTSSIINKQERAGLRGFEDSRIQNHSYIPAPSQHDIHHNAIGDTIFCNNLLARCS